MRRFLVVVVLLAAVAAALWWWRRDAAAATPRWTTAEVDRGRIAARVTAGGTLSALVTVQVGSQVSGRIASLHADFNSVVAKGQELATIDPLLFTAAVAQARANRAAADGNLAKARATLADAQRQARRLEELLGQRIVTQADADTAATAAAVAAAGVTAAEAGVLQAQAALEQAETNLGYTVITSPIDGVVISRSVDVGQTVAASLSAPTLFTIAEDLRSMQVDADVAESDVGRIADGMAATFRVDAWPEHEFSGTVRQVRNAAQTIQNVVTYDAIIDVANPDLRLKPGMTANVTFIVAAVDDALRLPNAALRFRPPEELASVAGKERPADEGGNRRRRDDGTGTRERTVWVLREGASTPVPVPVRCGITDGSVTEVVSGDLRDGDAVVIGGTESAAAPAAAGIPGMPRPPRSMRRHF